MYIAILFFLLALVALTAGLLGLIKPSIIKQTSRGKAFGKSMAAFIVFFIAFVIAIPKDDNASDRTITIKAKAHAYKVIGARERSTKIRKGGEWHIVSKAVSREDRVATMVVAAQNLFNEMNQASHASVRLFLDEELYKYGFAQIGQLSYTPDGKGINGKEDVKIWNIRISDQEPTQEHIKIMRASGQNSNKFKDKDGLVVEDKLKSFLANKFKLSIEEIDEAAISILSTYPGEKDTYQYDESMKYEILGTKSSDSVKNPESFNMSACQRDLQCWGDKHSIAAAVICAPYIEKIAKYDFEWTDGLLDGKFPYFRWKNKTKGVLTYIGDKIRMVLELGNESPINVTICPIKINLSLAKC